MSNAPGALFEFLFKYRPLVFAKGDLALGAPWPVLVVLVLGIAVVERFARDIEVSRVDAARGDARNDQRTVPRGPARAGEVPARFRTYVEQYYRSLAAPKP